MAPVVSVPSWWERHVPLIDGIVVVAVFAYNLAYVGTFVASAGWPVAVGLFVVSVFLCAPYLWRRRHPFAAFAVMLGAAYAQLLLNAGIIFADVLLVLMVFFVASRFRWPVSAAATGTVLLWSGLASVQLFDEGYLGLGGMLQFLAYLLLVWLAGMLVRVRRDHVDSLRERARELERQRDVQAQIAASDERARIARDIHDVVSHSLSVVVLMTDGAISKVRSDPARAEEALITARETGRAAMAEMRRMVGVLRSSEAAPLGPQPGVAQLQALVDESRAAGLPVGLVVSGSPVPLPESLQLCVYRIAQEGLTNARKHGGSSLSSVDVRLTYAEGELTLEISDDGRGMDREQSDGAGHGLVGMRERVALYGGHVRTGGGPGSGFSLAATFPLDGGLV